MNDEKQEVTLNRDSILAAQDRVLHAVPVPEWGGNVMMRELSGRQREEFEDAVMKAKGPDGSVKIQGLRFTLLRMSLVDADGNPLFSSGDEKMFNEKSSSVVGRLFDKARQINGIGEQNIEAAEKNS